MKNWMFGLLACAMVASLGCKDKETIPAYPDVVTRSPEPMRLPPPINQVEAEEIDETNYQQMAGNLSKEINRDHRSLTKVGREGVPDKK